MSTISGHGLVQVAEEVLFELICQLEVSPELSALNNQIVEIEERIRSRVSADAWEFYLQRESIESQYRMQLVTMLVQRISFTLSQQLELTAASC